MKARLKSLLFSPPWWAIFLNPHFLPRRALCQAMRAAGPALRGRVLDVGCGTQPYRELLTAASSVTGLELDTPANRAGNKLADVFYNGRDIPFPDHDFDGVLCNQVLEHADAPEALLAEFARVLAPGGTLILTVPFIWPEHEQPQDMQRFTSFGLKGRLRAAGFELISYRKLVGGTAALAALLADRLNARVSRFPLVVRLLTRASVIASCSLFGAIMLLFPSKDPDIYLDNFIVVTKRGVE